VPVGVPVGVPEGGGTTAASGCVSVATGSTVAGFFRVKNQRAPPASASVITLSMTCQSDRVSDTTTLEAKNDMTSTMRDHELDTLARRYGRGVREPDGTLRLSALDRMWLENVASAGALASAESRTAHGRPDDWALNNPRFMRAERYRMRPADVRMEEWHLTVLQAARLAGCEASQLASLALHGWVPGIPTVMHGDLLWRFRAAEVEAWSYDGQGVAKRRNGLVGPKFVCRNGTILTFPRGYR
jgi:hypothetical protein